MFEEVTNNLIHKIVTWISNQSTY